MLSFSLLPLMGSCMGFTLPCVSRRLPLYAHPPVLCGGSYLWPVSISSCVVRLLSVVCISLSCCAAVISMLGLRTALCCAVDFVCCLCTAAACVFDSRMSVLPVLRFLLSYGCCLNRIRCCMVRPMAALRFSYAVLRGAYGGGFLAVWFGVGNARMRLGGGSLPCFCTLSSFFALFLTFCFRLSPRLMSPSSLSAFAFARSLAFPLFLSSFLLIPFFPLSLLSLRAFLGERLSSFDLLISGGIYYII